MTNFELKPENNQHYPPKNNIANEHQNGYQKWSVNGYLLKEKKELAWLLLIKNPHEGLDTSFLSSVLIDFF